MDKGGELIFEKIEPENEYAFLKTSEKWIHFKGITEHRPASNGDTSTYKIFKYDGPENIYKIQEKIWHGFRLDFRKNKFYKRLEKHK